MAIDRQLLEVDYLEGQITARDLFAAAALVVVYRSVPSGSKFSYVAEQSFKMANAMLEARGKRPHEMKAKPPPEPDCRPRDEYLVR